MKSCTCYLNSGLLSKIEKDQNNDDLYEQLGYVYYSEKNYELAQKNFKKAIEINNENLDAHNWYNLLLAKSGNHNQAIQNMLSIIGKHPADQFSLFNLASIYEMKKDNASAINYYNNFVGLVEKRLNEDYYATEKERKIAVDKIKFCEKRIKKLSK